ncbi:hypothetical protein NE236_41365 [Actinoallomurus purpureus]|uniref:hypothetical protein n=1 Tax=Actinoallomurus purpureus TaxID=478114 RepID=UPI002091F983|nr:hypothetical protein [Actinoallomurus purpureus]MCO6011419.1 hypothetical protein [Actinoallomurus purpureus]
MRVVATETFKVYYRMVCIDVAAGEAHDGEFAEFLASSGAPVEVVGADTAPTPAPDPAPPADPDPAGDSGPEDPASDGELDITGTAAAVLDWVADDPERAAEAHAAESAKDKPRSTLLKKLAEIAGS